MKESFTSGVSVGAGKEGSEGWREDGRQEGWQVKLNISEKKALNFGFIESYLKCLQWNQELKKN